MVPAKWQGPCRQMWETSKTAGCDGPTSASNARPEAEILLQLRRFRIFAHLLFESSHVEYLPSCRNSLICRNCCNSVGFANSVAGIIAQALERVLLNETWRDRFSVSTIGANKYDEISAENASTILLLS